MDEMTYAASDAGCAGAVETCINEIHADIVTASNRSPAEIEEESVNACEVTKRLDLSRR